MVLKKFYLSAHFWFSGHGTPEATFKSFKQYSGRIIRVAASYVVRFYAGVILYSKPEFFCLYQKIIRNYIKLFLASIAFTSLLAHAELVPSRNFDDGDSFGNLSNWFWSGKGDLQAIPDNPKGIKNGDSVHVIWEKEGSGNRYLGMQGQGKNGSDFAIVVSDPIKVLPGFEYEASFRYKASGLMPESGDRTRYASAYMDIFFHAMKDGRQVRIGSTRIYTYNNADDWVTLTHSKRKFRIPEGTQDAQLRLQITNLYPDSPVAVGFDDIVFRPLDPALPNSGFEEIDDRSSSPKYWYPVGSADTAVADEAAYSGKYGVSVSNAPNGGDLDYSGWATDVPVRADRSYRFGGWVKGGDLQSGGYGAGFCLQYLDREGQQLGKPFVSHSAEPKSDWTQLTTPASQPPAQAVTARLSACMNFTRGTAWFDEMTLQVDAVESKDSVRLKRDPQPSGGVVFAENLLLNGTVEAGADNNPDGWTYVGRPEIDWTKADLDTLYANARPDFSVGRGHGEWSRDTMYAGDGALLNVSIDPPRSPRDVWYGRNPVDGFWLSDPMACEPGKAYLAAAWIRPGVFIQEPWLGPLEVRFYNAAGRQLSVEPPLRSGIAEAPASVWTWWTTLPREAPKGAVTMRLRFGQEYSAAKGNGGGWGRTYADNLAVWELPENVPVPSINELALNTKKFQAWFQDAHSAVRPPYLPSPAETAPYESIWGTMRNAKPGNLFSDPGLPVQVKFDVFNVLGEERTLHLRIQPTDWRGKSAPAVTSRPFSVKGYSSAVVEIDLPSPESYGAFHLDAGVVENESEVGRMSGRFAVIPPFERPRTQQNIWGVMINAKINPDGGSYEDELGQVLKKGGYGLAWVRMYFPLDPIQRESRYSDTLKTIEWYRSNGIRVVLQLLPDVKEPVNSSVYKSIGRTIGAAFNGKVAAIGNFGIEMVNSSSPFRRYSDEVYDTVMAALYNGIKDAAPDMPVLVGNIATDWEAKTLRRLYGKPVFGHFDGAILNPYLGLMITPKNSLREMDLHSDGDKAVWIEESSAFIAPFEGEPRRYGEADGTKTMVRTFLSWAALAPRIKAITSWSFVSGKDEVYNFVNSVLQPRPQYVAHAIMADAMADAKFVADRSIKDITIFEWKRQNGPLFTVWANAGEKNLTLDAPTGDLQVMDLMGNRQSIPGKLGRAVLSVTTSPLYLWGGNDSIVKINMD